MCPKINTRHVRLVFDGMNGERKRGRGGNQARKSYAGRNRTCDLQVMSLAS